MKDLKIIVNQYIIYILKIKKYLLWKIEKKDAASASAIRQLLDISSAFNYISYKKEENFIYFLKNKGESKSYELLNDLIGISRSQTINIIELKRLFKNCFNSSNRPKKNLLFSLIIMLIFKSSYWNQFKLSNTNWNSIWKANGRGSKKKDNSKKYIIIHTDESEKYLEQVYKETYKTILEDIDSNIKIDNALEELIDYLFVLNGINKISAKKEFDTNISNNRSKLREELTKARKIDSSNPYYSDIIGEGIQQEHIKYLEAAHIWEVKQIRKEGKELNTKDLYDPNNGLLISQKLHKALDSDIIQITINGDVRYNSADEEQIEKEYGNSLKISKAKIRKEVLNDQMKEYIKKRYNL